MKIEDKIVTWMMNFRNMHMNNFYIELNSVVKIVLCEEASHKIEN